MCRVEYVFLVTYWCILATTGNIVRNEDICETHNGRRLYLEMGEKGILYAKNVTFVKNSPRQQASHLYATSNSSHHQCSLELVTCPSCVIIVTFKNIALSHHCGDGNIMMDSSCRCDYVWLSEPPYEDVSGTSFCGLYAPITYRSSTRILSINLFYSQSHKHAFTLEYTAERNRLHLKGTEMRCGASIKASNCTDCGILISPFFPARYPRDLGLEYIITCPNEAPSCRIRLLFSDFQLATVSVMEFYDWNGQRLDVSSGARFRPPLIMSSGPSLLIRFYANGGTGLGYKAFYSFVIGHTFEKSIQPITDCGGYVENMGGTITMMNMVNQGLKIYDCVWLIRPPKNYLYMKTHIYLKVVDFTDMAGNTELIIKQGPTSTLMSLEIIKYPRSQLQISKYKEHVAPISSGFHVSLRGIFGPNSRLAIAYAAFNYMDCFAGSDFLCQNHRCIQSQLNCDGFDHCGDNSDEPTTCFHDWEMQPRNHKWHMNKANYYFPKIDQYPDLKTATLVFVAGSLGLIVLISALIILLYRIGAKARQQRELQSRLETISGLLDSARIDDLSTPLDDPPSYEAPPGYEEVAKLALQENSQSSNREFCNRSSSSRHDEDVDSSTYLVVQDANNGQPTPILSENDRQLCISRSPPPPYITPSGTVSRNLNIAGLSTSMRQICPVPNTWLRHCTHFSQALSTGRSHHGNSFSIDGYLEDYPDPNTNRRFESSPTKEIQSIQTSNSNSVQKDMIEILKENNHHFSAENTNENIDSVTSGSKGRNTTCSCEGACSCAINTSNPEDLSICNLSTLAIAQLNTDECETLKLESDQVAIEFSFVRKTDMRQDEDLFISKSAIIRFLNSKTNKPSHHSISLSSSPFGTLYGSSKRSFTSSRDNHVTRISTINRCHSYEKLYDESEIVNEVTNIMCTTSPNMMTNTPNGTPNGIPKLVLGQHGRCRVRRHSSCDLDNLYMSIKVLNSYLTRKNLDINSPSP